MSDINSFSRDPQNQPDLTGNYSAGEPKSTVKNFNFIRRKIFKPNNILIALALLCVFVLLGHLLESGFFAAMCLFAGIVLMPVFSRELRQDQNILLGYWFVIFLHQIIAFTNAYLFTTYGAEFDAGHFQKLGEEFALYGDKWSLAIGAEFYAQMLGQIYSWFGASYLLGEQLSILAFAFSCIILLKIIRLLGIVKYKIYSLLAFGTLPTMLFLGSITLRESYQVLFFMSAVFFGLKMHIKGGVNTYILAFALSVFFMCILHRGLIGYGMFIVLLFLIWSIKPTSRLRHVKKFRLAVLIIGPIVFLGIATLLEGTRTYTNYAVLISSNWLDEVSNVRIGPVLTPGRTTYGIPFDPSSYMMAIYSGLRIYLHYLFAPFPWQVNGFLDAYAALESSVRMILIYFSLKYWCNSVGSQKRLLSLMLILYVSITFLFSIGTANYGTAMRHHMLSWWIIVIIGIPSLLEKLSCVRFGRLTLRRKQLLKSPDGIL